MTVNWHKSNFNIYGHGRPGATQKIRLGACVVRAYLRDSVGYQFAGTQRKLNKKNNKINAPESLDKESF